MTSRKNLQELVEQLLTHVEAATGQYRKDLVLKVIQLCSSEKYALLQDFSWYLDILFKLSFVSLTDDLGELLGKQIIDIALRVLPVRSYAVKTCCDLLAYPREVKLLPQVLPATAWVVGEYADLLESNYRDLIQTLTSPSNIGQVSFSTQSVYLQVSLKVFASAANNATDDELEKCVGALTENLPFYLQSLDSEVQERAFTSLEIMRAFNLTQDLPNLPSTNNSNLLQMAEDSKAINLSSSSASGSLASRCRSSSSSLNFIFKPEPMKPISSKTQRKKSHTPKGGIDMEWLMAPINSELLSHLDDSSTCPRPTLEQINFTHQNPSKPLIDDTAPVIQKTGLNDMIEKTIHHAEPDSSGGEKTGLNQSRTQDPFYLNAGSKDTENDNPLEGAKFGTIQLLGSDDEEEDIPAAKKKRKKEKKRKKQKPAKDVGSLTVPTTALYDDDEDDDDNYVLSSKSNNKSSISKDFAGLASVDLSKPLGEDDVIMPKREHRQVPQKPVIAEESPDTKKKKKKNEKKKSKKKKSSSRSTNEIGDLLNLGGFSPMPEAAPSVPEVPSTIPAKKSIMNQTNTSTSSAFDDLLGLEAPSVPSTPDPFPNSAPASKTKKMGKKLWMKATLKNVASAGSTSIDWNKVSVHYKITPKSAGEDVFIAVRVDNKMSALSLNKLSIAFKSQGKFDFGTVAANDSEEKKKIGPFKLERVDSSLDLKASLTAMENCKVSINFTLPASLNFIPTPGLTLDGVMEELSSEQFASFSSKVEISNMKDADQVKAALSSFFNASLVEDSWMLAAQSVQGAKVRVLLKMKDTSAVKVDIKSTSASLCKSLATDVKKLLL
eukprot:CAMPEP_0178909936 /NCGR_PEP_ID=MMETSP0786-20121207/8812_1 /TAXON_ID=186022 /ORGANISM="Thalassionema frauenfeldii, Strain CCMP 1798" /LENGTH=831 /DNA_ID=CAMNT_0020582119 /DNA_START=128 /DNA_END=2623 /DNA_ORIENTATION=-